MKTNILRSKLSLNKATIVDLENSEMKTAIGWKTMICPTYIPEDSVCLICTGNCSVTCVSTDPDCSVYVC